ncbi:MAG: antitoxin [Candidatus Marinimicrobia bacterium]|nr:antitoxin [Candidatus Neomarinimicrobiota bacterium]
MQIKKSFIVNDEGEIQSVVLDYKYYQRIEESLLDYGLSKAMEEVEDDDELDLDETKLKLRYKNEG